jgi:cellulose synthase operon protein C
MKHIVFRFPGSAPSRLRAGVLAAVLLSTAAPAATFDGTTSIDDILGRGDIVDQLLPDGIRGLHLPPALGSEAEQTEQDLRDRVARYPANADVLKQLALFYVGTGRLAEATETLEKALALAPKDTDLALDVARLIAASKGPVAARAALERFEGEAADPFPFTLAGIQLGHDTGARSEARARLAELAAIEGLTPDRRRSVQLLLARYMIDDGVNDEAERLVEEVLVDDPADLNARVFRAVFRLNRLDLEGARADIATGLASDPDNLPLLRLSARAEWRAGERETAIGLLEKAAGASGNQPDVVLDLAGALEELGRGEEALDRVTRAARDHAQSPVLLARLGTLQITAEAWDLAEVTAAKLRRFETPSALADSEKLRIAVLQGRGQTEAAMGLLRELGAGGGDIAAIAAVINDHLSRDELAQAQDYVEGLIGQAGPQPALILMRGSLSDMAGEAEAAEADYRKVVRTLPQSPLGHVTLARHLLRRDDAAGAEAVIRAGLEIVPNAPTLKLPLVEILLRRGDHAAAVDRMEELVEAYPDNPVIANNYVSLVTEYMPGDSARLSRAVSVSGQLKASPAPQFRDTYAWLLHVSGDSPAAGRMLETVLAETPEDVWANYHAGMVYKALGETDKALAHLEKVLRTTDPNFDKTPHALEAMKLLKDG